MAHVQTPITTKKEKKKQAHRPEGTFILKYSEAMRDSNVTSFTAANATDYQSHNTSALLSLSVSFLLLFFFFPLSSAGD
jgi:hypothetical protein